MKRREGEGRKVSEVARGKWGGGGGGWLGRG